MTVDVVLYTRDGCHLCEEARDQLVAIGLEGVPFQLHEVDIESDERLHRELLELIPVVEVNGRRISELGLDGDAFRAAVATFDA